ncbi:hypothetical protein AB6A40_007473 [Gnathostoma spinigerum]|uniref:Chitin synthase 1 n=1 Tax=Gnathostoma spinigerum TaxID=75299 RepID=A0ABD6ETZ5_9BILA
MVGIFLFAALIHPQEFYCIVYGLVFFLMIPSTYVFLSLYSLINLNVINWGTREAVARATGKEAESPLSVLARKLGLRNFFQSLASVSKRRTTRNGRFEHLEAKLDLLERALLVHRIDCGQDQSPKHRGSGSPTEAETSNDNELNANNLPKIMEKKFEPNRAENPYMWMDAEYMQVCSRGRLNPSEEEFWNQLIDQYLKPIETTAEENARVAEELAALRNRIASSILIVNGLLVLAIFLIQKHKDILSFQYKPFEEFEWMKLSEKTGKFELTEEPLKIEPLGLVIIIFLMGILLVQTLGMLIHRVNTLIGAFHEVSNMEDFELCEINSDIEDEILEDARQMRDTALYDMAHGADGYTRANSDARSSSNVLYKLQRGKLLKHSKTKLIAVR